MIIFNPSSLKAALLFASNDEEHIAINCVRIEVDGGTALPRFVAVNGIALAVVALPQPLGYRCEEPFAASISRPMCGAVLAIAQQQPETEFNLALLDEGKCLAISGQNPGDPDVATVWRDACPIPYPDWRKALPPAGPRNQLLDPEWAMAEAPMQLIAKAAKELGGRSSRIQMVEAPGNRLEARIAGVEHFYAMVMKPTPETIDWQPEFVFCGGGGAA